MPLERVATWRDVAKDPVSITVDGVEIVITRQDVASLNTADDIRQFLETLALTSAVELPRIYVHLNRDRSVAVATGREPAVWPEDEVEEGPSPSPSTSKGEAR